MMLCNYSERKVLVTKTLTWQKQVVLMSKWNLIHSMDKLMMLSKMYYQRNQPLNRRYNNNNNNNNRGRSNRGRRGGRSYRRGVSKRHKNPADSHGNISRCRTCESINYWEDNCLDNPYGKSKGNTEEVVLYQSVLHALESMQQFTGETLSAAVLDSGATSTVCRKTWIDC